MYANWCQTFHRHTLLSAIRSKKDFPLRSFLGGVWLEQSGLEGYFKIIFWNIWMACVTSPLSVKTHVTKGANHCGHIYNVRAWPQATANSSRSGPHIKALLTDSPSWDSNVALEWCSVSKKEPETMSLHSNGSRLSWCEKKQRKWKGGKEAKMHSHQALNDKKENKRD